MAKEALFNILYNQLNFMELEVLDLFSGTGNIAYEFHSRECKSVVSVEKDAKCIQFIKTTKEKLSLQNLTIVQQDCFSFLEQTHQKFDLIFADPPYDMPDFERIAKLVFERELLRPDGMLIIEHSRNTSLHSFQQYSHTRNYGSVHFSFFEAQ